MVLVVDNIRLSRDDFHTLEALRWKSHDAATRMLVLTQREREILVELADGCSNKHVARRLAISHRTVEIHRANIMRKLGMPHLAEAARLVFFATLFDE